MRTVKQPRPVETLEKEGSNTMNGHIRFCIELTA